MRRLKKVLKISSLILAPLSIAFILLIRVNYLDYERPIPFERIDEITFENFRGLEFFKKSLYGNERFAYIVTTIETEFEKDSLTIQAYFHPSKSFVYKTNAHSPDLLSHELYHFRITEIFARTARQRITNLKNPSKKEIELIVNNTWLEEREYQQKYDYDTFHSYVYGEQKKYENTIDSLLHLLEKFEDPKVKLNE
ncbi:hypothetical protein [Flagellimonas flava]|uniref:hypothetical protein n=1 Tax=Flagellimonas flava TaxID=570519 RepID=UPI003D65AC17